MLFQAMNGSSEYFDELMSDFPVFKIAFFLFMVMSNWAILAILTAVVSEGMLRTVQREEELAHQASAIYSRECREERLDKIFETMDADGSGCVTETELRKLLDQEHFAHELCD